LGSSCANSAQCYPYFDADLFDDTDLLINGHFRLQLASFQQAMFGQVWRLICFKDVSQTATQKRRKGIFNGKPNKRQEGYTATSTQ